MTTLSVDQRAEILLAALHEGWTGFAKVNPRQAAERRRQMVEAVRVLDIHQAVANAEVVEKAARMLFVDVGQTRFEAGVGRAVSLS